ncbi:MAG TPA: Na/Pi cotransporter family protein [Bauldia sp.]|nr:Na/Pi cotransporter family protein [Bauldia sp.]
MNQLLVLINIAGTVALLLWGTRMVQTGVQRAFGARLRTFLASALRNRFRAFVAGLGVTALLQSSTATGLMTAGLAAGGLVALVPAFAVMLGANVGTTLIVQALSLDVAGVYPALILAGVLMFRRSGATITHDLGRVAIGLGLMLLALHQLLGAITPIENAPALAVLFDAAGAAPLLLVILAAALTWAAHSSVAVVLFVMSLASRGAVSTEVAFALVLGANLGTAINPVLEGAAGEDAAGRRLALGNLVNRTIGVVAGMALVGPAVSLIGMIEPDSARAVADFHTLFNLVVAAVFFPLLTPFAALMTRWLPARPDPSDAGVPLYLDPAAREVPALALGGAAREALRLADVLEQMLAGVEDCLQKGDRKRIDETRRLDDVLDRLNTAIKSYLTSLPAEELSDADHRRLHEILTFATNLEFAGDAVDRSLLPLAAKRLKRGLAFSAEGQRELGEMLKRVRANVRSAASLLMTDDARTARLLAGEKEAFRDMENAATQAHFARLRQGRIETAEGSALHLDIIRDLKRINSHLVAGAAYPVLERGGELLPTRIGAGGRS